MILDRDYYWDQIALDQMGNEFLMDELIYAQYSDSTWDPLTQLHVSTYDYLILPKGMDIKIPSIDGENGALSTVDYIKAPWE